ncbi:MAG: D-alanyl-D-alanine carboxypeptidase/D-alanyl-D-alanine-endopeptidase [Thermodesulforhabdaceae bacterium]
MHCHSAFLLLCRGKIAFHCVSSKDSSYVVHTERKVFTNALAILTIFFVLALNVCAWAGENALFSPVASQIFSREWATAKAEIGGSARVCGIEIRRLPDGHVVFAENNHVPLVAASLTKVLTSLAALKKLGPNHVFKVELRGQKPQGGVIPGNLYVFSNGNPLWFSRDVKSCIETFVTSTGVKTIQGNVIVDQRFFSPSTEQLCLDGKCYRSYNPTISAVAVDFNNLVVTVYPGAKVGDKPNVAWGESWSVPIPIRNSAKTVSAKQGTALSFRLVSESGNLVGVLAGRISIKDKCGKTFSVKLSDPSRVIAGGVKNLLMAGGVRFGGRPVSVQEESVTTLFSCRTPTLADVLHGINRHSNNFMAEMLLRHLGGEVLGAPGTREKGTRVVAGVLQEIGIPSQEFYLDSGSGLSYTTKASPATFGAALSYLYRDPVFQTPFLASLAESGREGTLKRHWAGMPFRVKGKTGTLANAVGFSGYVFWNDNAAPFAVTYICNNVSATWKVRQAMDKFVWKSVMALKKMP